MYAFITEIKNIRKHSNADRLNVGECFGNQVIVGLEVAEGDRGVYIAVDSEVGERYATENKLLRPDGYLDPNKRRIVAMKLRGEISDGLFMPLESLDYLTDTSQLKLGDCVDVLEDEVIAKKFIPKGKPKRTSSAKQNNKMKKPKRVETFPSFAEHCKTNQLAYFKKSLREGDVVTISSKLHGTSGRTARTLRVTRERKSFLRRLLRKPAKCTSEYVTVSGTRRTILRDFNGGFYGDDSFRKVYNDYFDGKLLEGEQIFYEIVGYVKEDTPIMGRVDNSKLGKEFVRTYGDKTTYTYGCKNGEHDIYVYRMTYTSPEGIVFEYPTWLAQKRAEEMHVKFVPVFDRFIFTTQEDLDERVEKYLSGPDSIDSTHIREGIVVRVENRASFTALKHKNFEFKVLEGIAKNVGIDVEEAEEIATEEG